MGAVGNALVRRTVHLAGTDEASGRGRAPVMTIAMFHEVRAAQDRLAAQMVAGRRGMGTVLALNEAVARDPLVAWHSLKQPGGLGTLCR